MLFSSPNIIDPGEHVAGQLFDALDDHTLCEKIKCPHYKGLIGENPASGYSCEVYELELGVQECPIVREQMDLLATSLLFWTEDFCDPTPETLV